MSASDWNGDDLRRLLERKNLERGDLADAINAALETTYSAETVGRWLRGRPPAAKVRAFLDQLAVDPLVDELELEPGDQPLEHDDGGASDSAPGPGPAFPPTPAVGGRGAYTRACEELVEMIATGVGLIGASLGSPALMGDGAIIAQDKAALGAAYGKLAEQNETFRRMLMGMTSGGVWMQVAVVTGTTFSKCWQGHAYVAAQRRQHAAEANGGHDTGDEPHVAVA